MDRPSRNRKSVNYFQGDDDEDFACVKPPPKKARTDPDADRNCKTASASPNLTSSGNRKRVSLDDKCYDRDLEAALTLSLLDTSKPQDGELRPKTVECSADYHDKPLQCSPPVLIHCSADTVAITQPCPNSPPVLSSCSVDGRSLGLDLISIDASPPKVSKQMEATEKQRKSQKGNKGNKDDDDYQPQNTPDSESDADFTEGDESEDETFTVKKKKEKGGKQKTEKKTTPVAKEKKEKKDKKPIKASKAKSSAPSPAICCSPAAPVSGLKKTPSTPPLSRPALCSSPAGGRLPKWNPPALVGRSPGGFQNAPVKSPGQGLRLGLSRRARVKSLHPNVAAN